MGTFSEQLKEKYGQGGSNTTPVEETSTGTFSSTLLNQYYNSNPSATITNSNAPVTQSSTSTEAKNLDWILSATDDELSSELANNSEAYSPKTYTDEQIISAYEGLKSNNLLSRIFNKNKSLEYDRKQALYPVYQQAKYRETAAWMNDKGITSDMVLPALNNNNPNAISKIRRELQEKYGLTQDQVNAAVDYVDALQKGEIEQKVSDYAGQNWGTGAVATLGSFLSAPIEATADTVGAGINYALGNPISKTTANVTQNIRDTVSEDMGVVGKTLYGAGTSIGDMLIAAATGGGGTLMGIEKASQVIQSATERGLTPKQIMAEGVLSGLTTAITEGKVFESFGESMLGGLTAGAGDSVAKGIVKSALKGFFAEGGQEVAEGVLDYVVDQVVANLLAKENKTEANQKYNYYISQGKTYAESKRAVALEYLTSAITDFIAGGLAGGLMSGGAYSIGAAQNYANINGNDINLGNLTDVSPEEQAKIDAIAKQVQDRDIANRIAEEQKANEVPNLTELLAQANQIPNVNAEQNVEQTPVELPQTNDADARAYVDRLFALNEQLSNAEGRLTEFDRQAKIPKAEDLPDINTDGMDVETDAEIPFFNPNENPVKKDSAGLYSPGSDVVAALYDNGVDWSSNADLMKNSDAISWLNDVVNHNPYGQIGDASAEAIVKSFIKEAKEKGSWDIKNLDKNKIYEEAKALTQTETSVKYPTSNTPDSALPPTLDPTIAEIEAERETNMPVARESEYNGKSIPKEYKEFNDTINSMVNMFGGAEGKVYKQNLYSLINEYMATKNPELFAQIVDTVKSLEKKMTGSTYTNKKTNKRGTKQTSYTYPTNWGTITEVVDSLLETIDPNAYLQYKATTNSSISVGESQNNVVDFISKNGNEATWKAYNDFLTDLAEAQESLRNNVTLEENPDVYTRPLDDIEEIGKTLPAEKQTELYGLMDMMYSEALKSVEAQNVAPNTETEIPTISNVEETPTVSRESIVDEISKLKTEIARERLNAGDGAEYKWNPVAFDKKGSKKNTTKSTKSTKSTKTTSADIPRVMAEDTGIGNTSTDVETELPDGTLSITEDVPYLHKNADGSYVAQTAYNTVAHNLDENSEQGGKQFEKKLYDGSMVVQTITEPESRKRAVEALKKDYKGEKASLERMDSIGTGVDTDKSMIILDKELAKADETGDYTEVNRWARVIVDRMHNIAQAMQALAKYTRTAAGTVAKAERLRKDKTDNWSKQAINKSKVERAQKIAKALEYVIVGENLDTRSNGTKTHEQILEGVKNEFNDTLIVANEFTDEDMDFLATLIEQGTPTWIIANEIENKIETGAFFDTIEEASINQDFNKTRNQKLNNLIKSLKEEGVEIKERRKQSFEEIRKEVANTIENSKDFRNMSDEDIDYLARMVERGASSEYLTNELVAYKSNGNFGLSSEDIKQINELFKQMQDLNPESKEATKLWEQACAIAAKNLGNSSFAEKTRAWRYMAMLLSSTTHERNIFGNGIFGSITDMKDNIAAGLEKVLAKSDPDMGRTKSVVSRIKDGDFLKAAGDYYAENTYASAVEDGSKFDAGDKIQREKRVFKSDKLEKLRKFSSDSLEIEDEMAIRRKYKRALVGYLKANGATVEIFTSDNAADVELLKKASDYALQQAKIATFHEKNKTAEVLSQWSTTANQGGTLGTKALALMLDSTLPFKKTPANVLKQGAIEYNPVVQVGKLIYQVATKQSNTAKADTAAKALTGSALLVLGILGRMTGVLKANYDDDDKFFGDQKFSINIGDFSYTIDWAAPGVLGVLSGAALYDAFEDGQIDGADLLDALASVGEPIVETSMLEGISNLIENIAYSVQGQGNAADKGVAVLGATASSMVSNYASQFIPTTVSKAARVIDPYRRTTYTKDTGVLGTFERVAKKTINSIPFVSMLNDPDIDEWGNEVRNSGFFNEMAGTDATILDRAIANFASPGYANNTARTEVEAELERLNGTEHEKNIIPSDPAKTYEGERLTQKQYIAMSRAKGQYTGDALETFFSSNCYNMLDDLSRTVVVNGLEGFCNALAKSEVLDYDIASNSTYKKAYATYKESGMQGVVDYYATKQAVKSEAGSLTDYTKVIPALEKLDMTDAEKGQYIADSKSSLSKAAQTFANDGDYEAVYQYYMISINANSNKDNGLTQDELIDYLQKSDMSPKECEYWLKVFYPNISNDKIPIFK